MKDLIILFQNVYNLKAKNRKMERLKPKENILKLLKESSSVN